MHVALARLAPARLFGALQIRQVEDVAVESEQAKRAAVRVHLLPVAIDKQQAGTVGCADQRPALGHHRDRRVRVAIVVNQDAPKLAVGLAGADVHRDPFDDFVERPLPQQDVRVIAADDEVTVPELAEPHRHEVQHDAVTHERHHPGEDQRRAGKRDLAQPGGAQDHELAVDGKPVVGVDDGAEQGKGQDDRQERWHQQQREMKEGPDRKPAVDDQIDEAQRMRQPHHAREGEGNEQHRPDELAQDVFGDSLHRLTTA